MNKLIIVAIFKNESHVLKEWIEHYIMMGVDKFYLIDNGSTDNYRHIIDEYIKRDIVTLYEDDSRHQQKQLYNKYCFEHLANTEWVMVVDLDEFVYAKNGFNTIPEYLDTLDENTYVVTIPWKMFGSNNYIEQPKSVIKSFTKRKLALPNNLEMAKTISRAKLVSEIGIHCCKLKINYVCPTHLEINEEIIRSSFLNLNHYIIQSFNWFMKVKNTRGSASWVGYDKVRNEKYFKKHDNNDVEDNELKLITISNINK